MAVSDRDIRELQRKQQEISRIVERTQLDLQRARDEVTAQNRKQLDDLRHQTEQRISEHEQIVLRNYESILNQKTSEQEQMLEREYLEYQRQYEELGMQISEVLMEEQRKNEEMLLRQQQFEKAYFQRQKFARERAEQSRRSAENAVKRVAETVPIEWFLSGHMNLYRTRLQEIARWIDSGFYESTIGISENLVLMLRLDELEVEKKFRQWFHYYTVLHEILQSQKTLLFDTAVRVPDKFTEFQQNSSIKDGRMEISFMDSWSDNLYSKLLEEYAKFAEEISQFDIHGNSLLSEEEMRNYMIRHSEKSALYQELTLYSNAMKAAQQLENTEKKISRIHDRMYAFNERLRLMKSVRSALKKEGYLIEGTSFFNGEPTETLVIRFCNGMGNLHFEFMLVPILRRLDERWINQAVCFTDAQSGEERLRELRHILADVLVTAEIHVDYEKIHENQTSEERVNVAVFDMKMKINGRLN